VEVEVNTGGGGGGGVREAELEVEVLKFFTKLSKVSPIVILYSKRSTESRCYENFHLVQLKMEVPPRMEILKSPLAAQLCM